MLQNFSIKFTFLLLLLFPLANSLQADTLVEGFVDVKEKEMALHKRLEEAESLASKDVLEAFVIAQEVRQEAKLMGSEQLMAHSSYIIGSLYASIGAYFEALEHIKKALLIFIETNDYVGKTKALMLIGNSYFFLNEYDLALDHYRDVYYLANEQNDDLMKLVSTMGKGSVYGNTQRTDSALVIFNETLQLSKEIKNLQYEIHSLFNLGDVYLVSKNYKKAIEVFQQIEREYNMEEDYPTLLSNFYFSCANTYLNLGDTTSVKRYIKKAERLSGVEANLTHQLLLSFLHFQLDTVRGHASSALKHYINYKRLNDSINDVNFRKELANFRASYELGAKEEEIRFLRYDSRMKDTALRQRLIINYGSAVLLLLLTGVVVVVFLSKRKSNQQNQLLKEQGDMLVMANEELLLTNEELFKDKNSLEEAMRNLQAAQNQLIQSEKMASLGLLAAGVAHEINNPLNFIQGGITALENYLKEHGNEQQMKETTEILEMMKTGVERSSIIVEGLSHYTRAEGASKQDNCNIHKIIDSCLIFLDNKIKDCIAVERKYTAYVRKVPCDASKMHQAMLQILENAIQFTDNNGQITVSTQEAGDVFQIIIEDNGRGISPEDLPRITDPFFTTRDVGEGTGLGLSIVRNIIEEHKGDISFESEIGKGTTVIIHLPME